MIRRFASQWAVSALAGAMAWVALWSWGGLVEQPGRFLTPALGGALLVVTLGAVGRAAHWSWYAVLPAQVLAVLVWFDHRYAAAEAWGGWVPTPASLRAVVEEVRDGATAVNTYSSPVSGEHSEIYAYLLATALLVLLSTDLLGCGLRRVPWAGLPVIVTLTVPISVLEADLSWVVFVSTSLLFMMLLATEETERVLGWGRAVAGRGERIDSLDQVVNGSTVRGTAFRIGLLTAAGALVVPVLIPVSGGLFKDGDGPGDGTGDNNQVTLRNPIVDLRRDLVARNHIPLVEARTAADPGYLRLTVLDKFNGVEWEPSSRRLATSNNADGDLPVPPGLAPTTAGTEAEWSLRLLDGFRTTWLPTPYPTRRIDVNKGDWRYDIRTLDIAAVDKPDTAGLRYRLTGFTPERSPMRMQNALNAPAEVRGPMTSVPGNRPAVINQIAEEVTAGATTDYDRMVALQDWFRSTGDFTYSLAPGPGSGITRLVEFLTTDKVGYCEQFAAAMAVLARSLGVPARVAVGFLGPAEKRDDGTYLYTSDDLHAWPEIYFSGSGWVPFEPTPGTRTGATPPAWTTGNTAPVPTAAPSASITPNEQASGRDRRRTEVAATDSSSDGGSTGPLAWAVAGLLLLVVAGLPRLVRSRQRRRRLDDHRTGPRSEDAADLAAGAWAELCATARDLGISLPLGRSVREIAALLRRRARPGSDAPRRLDELVGFVERARYGRPFSVDPATRQSVVEAVETWSDELAESVRPSRARLARVLPRSVFDRQPVAPVPADRRSELVGAGEVD